jgi:hypothetical protein
MRWKFGITCIAVAAAVLAGCMPDFSDSIPLTNNDITFDPGGIASGNDGGAGNGHPITQTGGLPSIMVQVWLDRADSALVADISSMALSRSGSNNVPKEAVIKGVTGSGYSCQWTLNGVAVQGDTGRPEQYTFDSALRGDGTYAIGLRVEENGVWYSTTITITVLN